MGNGSRANRKGRSIRPGLGAVAALTPPQCRYGLRTTLPSAANSPHRLRSRPSIALHDSSVMWAVESIPPPSPQPAAQPAAKQPQQPKAPVRPKFADYGGNHEQYEAALDKYYQDLARHTADQRFRELQIEQARQAQAEQVARVNRQIEDNWKSQVTKGRTAHGPEEYDAAIGELPAVVKPGSIIDAFVLQSECGGEVAFYLGLDGAAEARRIAAQIPSRRGARAAGATRSFLRPEASRSSGGMIRITD